MRLKHVNELLVCQSLLALDALIVCCSKLCVIHGLNHVLQMRRENIIQGRQTEFFFIPAAAFEDFFAYQRDRGLLTYNDFFPCEQGWDRKLFDLCVWITLAI